MDLLPGGPINFLLCGATMILECVFHLIGMATPYWMNIDEPLNMVKEHYGLWQNCSYGECRDIPTGSLGSRFDASRAFAVLGILACVGTGACLYLGQFTYPNKRWQLTLASLGAAIATFVCLIINIATFVEFVPLASRQYLSWSFALSATGLALSGVAMLLTGCMFLCDHRGLYSST